MANFCAFSCAHVFWFLEKLCCCCLCGGSVFEGLVVFKSGPMLTWRQKTSQDRMTWEKNGVITRNPPAASQAITFCAPQVTELTVIGETGKVERLNVLNGAHGRIEALWLGKRAAAQETHLVKAGEIRLLLGVLTTGYVSSLSGKKASIIPPDISNSRRTWGEGLAVFGTSWDFPSSFVHAMSKKHINDAIPNIAFRCLRITTQVRASEVLRSRPITSAILVFWFANINNRSMSWYEISKSIPPIYFPYLWPPFRLSFIGIIPTPPIRATLPHGYIYTLPWCYISSGSFVKFFIPRV